MIFTTCQGTGYEPLCSLCPVGLGKAMQPSRNGPLFKADNVVFFQIGSALYFYDFYRNFPWIGQLVDRGLGNIHALIFIAEELLLLEPDFGCALDYHPVLTAVMVHLDA